MRNRIEPSLAFLTLVLGAIVAGCSSAGHVVPFGGGSSGQDAVSSSARHRFGGSMRVFIPRERHRRRHHYISPATNSLTLGVQLVTASPWPAPLKTQVLVVATPSPCATITAGPGQPAGTICDFTVEAYRGKQIFTFNAYAQKSPVPSDTPLSTLTTGVVSVDPKASLPPFVLQGVVQSIDLAVPLPESSAAGTTQAAPIGTATSFPLAITALDAAGQTIATDTFATPITVSVTPASSGVTLSMPVSTCTPPPDAGRAPQRRPHASGSSVTITCASDLSGVNVVYDGSLTAKGGATGGYLDSFQIVASPQPATAPSPANLALSSATVPYTIDSGLSTVSSALLAYNAVDGMMYYLAYGATTQLGKYNPANPSAQSSVNAAANANGLLIDSRGRIWQYQDTTAPYGLVCYQTLAATPVAIQTNNTGSVNTAPSVIGEDSAGDIWWASAQVGATPTQIGFLTPQATCSGYSASTAAWTVPYNPGAPSLQGITAAAPGSNGAGIWLAYQIPSTQQDQYLEAFYTAGTGLTIGPNTAYLVEGLTSDGAGNVYIANGPGTGTTNPFVMSMLAAAGSAPVNYPALPANAGPLTAAVFSGSGTTATRMSAMDTTYDVDAFDLTQASPVALPIAIADASECGDTAYDANGALWASCTLNGATAGFAAEQILLTSTWNIATTSYVVLRAPHTSYLSLVETGVDSSPFTAISSAPSQISVGASPAGFTHLIPMTFSSTTASATITVTDKNGREVAAVVTGQP